ncbi:NHL repeat-containing protein 2 [Cryptotermes secundus]|uniref:NHL repeat-containing protein 2 n=1 Tax=Cryptotermes secundus TaxID=105785 RepID=A0A2J7PW87_9NEOP|nr:NHL repeat-containing protein 2 [Cryptotermes secundus]
MASDSLDPVSTSCEHLFDVLGTLHEKSNQEKFILDHIKKYASRDIQIDDFRSNLEWFNVSRPLSLNNDLRGKIVVLDFFTYCCINCMHILPQLKQLEEQYSVQDGLVVVGVHSAKFDNEKDSANILAAVQRYNITHPVVNDSDGTMWQNLGISCWPTLVIIGPNGEVLFILVGEGHKNDILVFVKTALNYYKNYGQLLDHSLPLAPAVHILPELKGLLFFPGKVACIGIDIQGVDGAHYKALNNNNDTSSAISKPEEAVNNNSISQEDGDPERLAVSDTGHHRIIVFRTSGRIEHVIGGDEPGFIDGTFQDARFQSPQGVVFRSPSLLYIADTENHAIREVNLQTLHVRTLVGSSSQGLNVVGGAQLTEQVISSPWDLCLVSSSLITESSALEESDRDVLLIAMAGLHQIWALFLNETTWWKGKLYPAGTFTAVVGSGKEENRNNSYPHAAGFAQPSGLSVANELQAVFVADSESSTIRKISLTDGKVSAVVGGDRSPFNLFSFGDRDGKQFDAKLQHPLGVAWCNQDKTLYIADSYNHKLKAVSVPNNVCTTVLGSGKPGNSAGHYERPDNVELNEPGGLCVSHDSQRLYVADTNNHCIKVVYLKDKIIEKLTILLPPECKQQPESKNMTGTILPSELAISSDGGEISLFISVTLNDGITLTDMAPQKWALEFPDPSWSANTYGGEYEQEMTLCIVVPKQKQASSNSFSVSYRLYVCREHSECSVRDFHFLLTVVYTEDAPTRVIHYLSHVVGLH